MTLKSPFGREVYERNARIYKLLSHPKRLEILNIIKDKEATVNDLSEVLGISQSNTSQHLSLLRYLRVVKLRRDGKRIFYRIADSRIVAACKIFKDLWRGDSSV